MPEVVTPSGRLSGLARDGLEVYLGIPYALPPVDALRFQPPVPVPPWSGTRTATEFGPSAPQIAEGPFNGLVPGLDIGPTSEDCLTLNVWSPVQPGATPPLLPVLVWLHGGAFVIGGSSVSTYDPSTLAAEQHVVVVSLNYRLGALGWLSGLPGVTANCGLLDQICALEWIRDHVASFGGDPGQVTLMGESAGAGSILHLLAAPAAQGLFHRAIVQSPGAGQTLTPEAAAAVSSALAARVGDLAKAPVAELLAAQTAVASEVLMTVGAMPFHPALDPTSLPVAPLVPGTTHPVPLLAGCTSEEMRLFVEPYIAEFDLPTLVAVLVPMLSAEAHRPLAPTAVTAVVEAYVRQLVPPGDHADVFAAVATDVVMRLPLADLLDSHTGPVHAYSFTWEATGAPRRVGACHGVDLPFVFGTLDRAGWGDWVGDPGPAAQLSRSVRAAWGSFARTGEPAAADLPAWPRYDHHRRVMELGRTVSVAHDPLAGARARCSPLR